MLFNRTSHNIKWVKPSHISTATTKIKFNKGKQTQKTSVQEIQDFLPVNSMLAAIHEHGIPTIEDTTPEQELIILLKAAAEVEHGLMIQYLYAANGTTDMEMSTMISGIAIEEMGHLLTVENILLAMNEKPYLGRYDKTASEFAPFLFSLEPLTKLAIAKFAACERPDDMQIHNDDRTTYNQIVEELESIPNGVIPERVGLLYMKIYWLLRETDDPVQLPNAEEWPGFPVEEMKAHQKPDRHVKDYPIADPLFQALRSDWYAAFPSILIFSAETRHEARDAIAKISAQGEGFANVDASHFDRFIDMYRTAQTGASITRDVPKNPWYQGLPNTSGDEITEEGAVKLAKLADLVYELVLNYIALAIHPDQTDPNKRSEMASFCVRGAMVGILRRITKLTQELPINPANSLKFAQCYTLPEGSSEISEIKARLETVSGNIKTICKELAQIDDLSLISDEVLVALEQTPAEFLT